MSGSRDGHGRVASLTPAVTQTPAERAALLAFIDAASPEPLLPYQRDFLAALLDDHAREWVDGLPGSFAPSGLFASTAHGYPYKPRHKPRRPRKVAR